MTRACIGEPISWLRLERHAVGDLSLREADEVTRHLQACPACRQLADAIAKDEVALVPLATTDRPKPRWAPRIWLMGPAVALAVMLLVIGIGRDAGDDEAMHVAGVKGGEVVIELIRMHGGALASPTVFTPGDRFKVAVTCAPARREMVDVIVYQGDDVFFPLGTSTIWCGNGQLVPGAFRLTGGPATVCVAVGGDSDHQAPPALESFPEAQCASLSPAP